MTNQLWFQYLNTFILTLFSNFRLDTNLNIYQNPILIRFWNKNINYNLDIQKYIKIPIIYSFWKEIFCFQFFIKTLFYCYSCWQLQGIWHVFSNEIFLSAYYLSYYHLFAWTLECLQNCLNCYPAIKCIKNKCNFYMKTF